MKISIVTPSYNQGDYIKQTIDSVIDQKFKNLEYLIMDGGSTDNTLQILKTYGTRLKWNSAKDRGQTDAINKGMKQSSGEIVAFLNSDDYYLPGTLSKVSKIFQDNPEIKWLTGDYRIVDQNNKEIQKPIKLYKSLLRKFPLRHTLAVTNMIVQPSTFWRREVFKEIGYFNEELNYTMDYEFWLRLIKKYHPYLLGEDLCAFRIHDNSKGGSRFQEQFSEELSVIKIHCSNRFLINAHKLHNKLIIAIYNIIR